MEDKEKRGFQASGIQRQEGLSSGIEFGTIIALYGVGKCVGILPVTWVIREPMRNIFALYIRIDVWARGRKELLSNNA